MITKFVLMEHTIKNKKHHDIRIKTGKDRWDSFAIIKKDDSSIQDKKLLAIRTKVHSETSALFTGKTKTGKISKIDSGACEILKYNKQQVVIKFDGSHLNGVYHFIYVLGKENHYLIFKGKIK